MSATPERPTTTAPHPSGSLLALVRRLLQASGALAEQGALHAELLRLGWQEERARLLQVVLAAAAGFAAFLCLALGLGALVLALTWGSAWRWTGPLLVLALYAAGLALAWWRLRVLAREGERSFAASREELAADLATLRSKL